MNIHTNSAEELYALYHKDIVHMHKLHWTPDAFGDLHYGTNLKKLRKHLSTLRMQTLLVEDAGISHSGNFIGRAADFTNFLLLGQVGERSSADWTHDQRSGRKHA